MDRWLPPVHNQFFSYIIYSCNLSSALATGVLGNPTQNRCRTQQHKPDQVLDKVDGTASFMNILHEN
jgi:hypothetical protein